METKYITISVDAWRKAVENEMILNYVRREIANSEYNVIGVEALREMLNIIDGQPESDSENDSENGSEEDEEF